FKLGPSSEEGLAPLWLRYFARGRVLHELVYPLKELGVAQPFKLGPSSEEGLAPLWLRYFARGRVLHELVYPLK
ncbi:hypothetical protein, partial [Streptococcus pneumoniae]|uniref:hypothetical protein n=1 Tax=Streptococcus pneumoniae TaxID=1313 RepID=UPI001CB78466